MKQRFLACVAVIVLAVPAMVIADEYQDSLRRVAYETGPDARSAEHLYELFNELWPVGFALFPQYKDTLEAELKRYRDAEAEPRALLMVEMTIGSHYKMMSEPVTSIRHLYAALALEQQVGDPELRAELNREIGLNYYLQGQWEPARTFFEKAYSHFASTGQERAQRMLQYLRALCESNTGQYAEAATKLKRLYDEWSVEKASNRILECGSAYADALRGMKLLDSAGSVYEDLIAFSHAHEETIAPIMGRLEAGFARVRMEQGRFEEARQLAESSLAYSRKFQYFFPQLEALEILYKTNKERKAWEDAYRYLEVYMHDRDSLQSEESRLQLGISQAVFEQERQQAQALAEEARKRQVLLVGLALSGILVIVVGLFYRTLSKQKRLSESLLANILPRETISELTATGTVTPRIHHGVSIMFCDVKEFTMIAEALSPEDLVSMLDTYIRRFDEIVHRHGLEKIKTIGDAYMVAGGLHGDTIQAARATVSAARDMLVAVDDLREECLHRYGFAYDYRIGIHTGNVIAGMVGRDKYAYDIWGDAVNVASRMEHHSEIGRINISGDTNEIVREYVPTEYRGKVDVKNKGSVDMYFVVDPQTGSTTK